MKFLAQRSLLISFLLTSCRRPALAICSANMSFNEEGCNKKGVHSIAYVTVPSIEVGKTLSRKIVENKLAACVNVIPQVLSIYEWKGEINEDNEALLMIKTRTSRTDDLIKFVKENHPYEVCEVITVPIDNGNPPYLQWISDTVPEKK